jgi:nicotinamidase-related amidase
LLVIDVQEKLLPAVPDAPRMLLNVAFLLDAAKLLDVPALATEQYPTGLGRTAPAVADRLPPDLPAKQAFSCCAVPGLVARVRRGDAPTAVLCGMETHVCVLQTGLDLLAEGVQVAVAADAVAARLALDHDLALRRLEREGAVLTTAETVVFEWLGTAAAPQFKAASALVRQRTRALSDLTGPGGQS